jgi:hypothetical protein
LVREEFVVRLLNWRHTSNYHGFVSAIVHFPSSLYVL